MSWKNNPSNLAPNVIQTSQNTSEVRRSVVQSKDTGHTIDVNQSQIPLVGPYKREFAMRRDLDNTQNFGVDLITIDTTIMDHMNKRLDIGVMDNGTLVKVPIFYASPERWKAVKADGFLRDNQGKILLPAILINRSSVSNNKDLMTFNRYLSYQIVTKFDQKNKYDKFDILNAGNLLKNNPTKQIYNVTLPDHVIITYECILWTDYIDQNNKILEKINFATHDYWGVDGFRFRTKIEDYTNTVEVGSGEDRNVKTTFNLVVNAYLLPTTIDGVKSTTQKTFTIRKIVVKDGGVDSADMEILKLNASNQNPYSYLKNVGVSYQTTPNVKLKTETPEPVIEKSMFRPAPLSTNDYGEDGWLAYDRDYIYVYKKPNGWLRKSITQFDFDSSVGQYVSGYDCDNQPIYAQRVRPINTAFRVFQRFPDKFYYRVPYQSSDYGEEGWISYDGDYFYIYSYGEWRRIPMSLFTETF